MKLFGPSIFPGKFVLSIAIGLVLATAQANGQTQHDKKGLPNLKKVNDNLYRGGQPGDDGLESLARLGIKTVINLRAEPSRTGDEAASAQAVGLQYHSFDMPAWGRPSMEQVQDVLDIVIDPANWPVFIHCRRGSDRTGTIVACYRISNDRWTVEQALEEAESAGMHWFQYWMRDFIGDYAREHVARSPSTSAGSSRTGFDDRIGDGIRAAEIAGRRSQVVITRFVRKSVSR